MSAFDLTGSWASRIIHIARNIAAQLKDPQYGSEHLLLAITGVEGTGDATRILNSSGVSYDSARQVVEMTFLHGFTSQPEGDLPISDNALVALELAFEEAQEHDQLEHAAEYILLALIDAETNGASTVLRLLDVDLDSVRGHIRHSLGLPRHPADAGPPRLDLLRAKKRRLELHLQRVNREIEAIQPTTYPWRGYVSHRHS